jgi:hypothetical protein
VSFDWLDDFAFNSYSQFGEDGVLQAIFSVIGMENEWCFECGASDGLFFSNTRRLLEQGWSGVLIEAAQSSFVRLLENSKAFGERVHCVHQTVEDAHRLESTLYRCGAPLDIDLAVIDVDGQDYYLWNSLLQYRPRVVVIEFDQNADDDALPTLGGPGQAGELTINRLGSGKFYTRVHRNTCNMIFVKRPLHRLLDRVAS